MSCASIPHRRGKTCRTLEKCVKTAFFYFLQVFSKICLTNASDMRIITHVDRLTQPGGTTDGDLHSGSAVDSDSTCGSSILSSPTKTKQSARPFSIRFAGCFLFLIHCKRPGASRELLPGHARSFLFQLRSPKWIRPAGCGLRRTHSRSSADSPDTETRGCWRCSGEAGHWHPRRQTA